MEKINMHTNIDTFRLSEGDGAKSVARVVPSEDPNRKTLEIISGDWSPSDPRFIVDENGVKYTLLTQEAVTNLVTHLRVLQNENFELKLEKAILQQMPIDYEDVLIVATKKIEEQYLKKGKRLQGIKLDRLLYEVRKEHPNLFYNIEDFLKKPPF